VLTPVFIRGVFMGRKDKEKRQKELKQFLEENPFYTDEELASHFNVSIQTIRLDRLALGIPELRERTKWVAQENYEKVKSITRAEIIGDLVDIKLNKEAISILDIEEDMLMENAKVAKAHYLFDQADSLAIALIDANVVLTGSARVRYKKPVYAGDRVIAKAVVKVKRKNAYLISVYSKVKGELVFKGQFIVTVQTPGDGGT
jgi:acyl-coenzyme A thioesterase PaaI-like protein